MRQDILYDLLIVGASKFSFYIVKELKKKQPDIKIAVISSNFNHIEPKQLEKVDSLQDTVAYLDYFRGLIRVYTKTSYYCARYVIVSTGTNQVFAEDFITEKLLKIASSDKVFPENSQDLNLAVLGTSNTTLATAIDLAKHFKQVYVCSPNMTFRPGNKTKEKIAKLKNIKVFNNCTIVDYKLNNGQLASIILDTYAELDCSKLVIVSQRKPDVPKAFSRVCKVNEKGALVVDSEGRTSLKNIYALGGCASRYSATALDDIVNTVLKK